MLIRLYLVVGDQELATDIYFKKQEMADRWLKHHYLLISQLVHLLRGTRDFTTEFRRIA